MKLKPLPMPVKQMRNAAIILLALFFGANAYGQQTANRMTLTLAANGEAQIRLDGKGPATIGWGDGSPGITRGIVAWTGNKDENKNTFKHAYSGTPPYTITISGENITDLECNDMGLTAIDVSQNAKLESLECDNNQLKQLDLRNNPLLRRLYCEKNQLTSLNLSKNPQLTILLLAENKLANLDVGNNPRLSTLRCSHNQLASLNLSKNPELMELQVEYNRLDASALNALFTSLHDNAAYDASKVLYINGNPGTDGCSIKIAEDSGWERAFRTVEDWEEYMRLQESGQKEENTDFEIENSVLVKYKGGDSSYVKIPDGVTSIGARAFFDSQITGVEIPDSVISIGEDAFWGCNFNSIVLPDSVKTIGEEALGYDRAGRFHTPIEGFIIYGTPGSAAEIYARENAFIRFISSDKTVPNK